MTGMWMRQLAELVGVAIAAFSLSAALSACAAWLVAMLVVWLSGCDWPSEIVSVVMAAAAGFGVMLTFGAAQVLRDESP